MRIERDLLRDKSDLPGHAGPYRLATDHDLSCTRLQTIANGTYQRRLARAVLAEQAKYLASLDANVDPTEDFVIAVAGTEITDLESSRTSHQIALLPSLPSNTSSQI
ncbi:hypothetical protein EMEDMD4_940012 [Sinorhizobium medicae]|uniref:Uncharacterized protein n=1 Tax=Sinorhizobium medicae TaxID=110321 RepID=A0A508XC01_9HYPH|nr:hypothetical protein EMEDMD4_940012 [Sinorhizobium medicae]